jgi:hypothetical protein
MYSFQEVDKLIDSFTYLIGENVSPAGPKGEIFDIISIEAQLIPRKVKLSLVMQEETTESEEEYSAGKNWNIFAVIEGHTSGMKTVELKELLDFLKIRYSFEILMKQKQIS